MEKRKYLKQNSNPIKYEDRVVSPKFHRATTSVMKSSIGFRSTMIMKEQGLSSTQLLSPAKTMQSQLSIDVSSQEIMKPETSYVDSEQENNVDSMITSLPSQGGKTEK
jgi:hypothetical protein